MSFGSALCVSVLLFLGSYLCGSLPLWLTSLQKRWSLTLGVGLLIGTAFVVILPEGIHTMYTPPSLASSSSSSSLIHPSSSSSSSPLDHLTPAVAPTDPSSYDGSMNQFKQQEAQPATITPVTTATPAHDHNDDHDHDHSSAKSEKSEGKVPRRKLLEDEHDHAHISDSTHSSHAHSNDVHDADVVTAVTIPTKSTSEADSSASTSLVVASTVSSQQILVCFDETHGSRFMGMALALGFVFMILIDRIHSRLMADAEPASATYHPVSMTANGVMSPSHRVNIELKNRSSSGNNSGSEKPPSPESRSLLSRESNPTPRLHVPPITIGSSVAAQLNMRSPAVTNANNGGNPQHSFPTLAPSAATLASSSSHNSPPHNNFDSTLMLGPLLYAFIDGCGLGVLAATNPDAPITFDLIMSILLHKAPLAFGFTCFLLYSNRISTLSQLRMQLFLYSLMTPLACMLCVSLLVGSRADDLLIGDGSMRGLSILFSGGAFIFTIAVHVLPEIQRQASRGNEELTISNGVLVSPSTNGHQRSATPTVSRTEEHEHADEDMIDEETEMNPSGNTTRKKGAEPNATIPWRYVWALICGLLIPMVCSYLKARKPLF